MCLDVCFELFFSGKLKWQWEKNPKFIRISLVQNEIKIIPPRTVADLAEVKTAGLRTHKDCQCDWWCSRLFWLSLDETYRNRCSPPWWGRGRGPGLPGPVGMPESPEPPEPLSAGAQRGVPCLQPPTPRSSSSPVPPQRFTSIKLDVWGRCQQVAVFRFDQPSCSSADFDEAEDNRRNKPACTEKNGW